MAYTREEQETIVRYNRHDGYANFYTTDPVVAAKWRKLGHSLSVCNTHKGEPVGWEAKVPLKSISYRNPYLPKRAGRTDMSAIRAAKRLDKSRDS